jgi:hypothetical protein
MRVSLGHRMAMVAALLLVTPAAWAQEFAKQGQLAVSAERLFGVVLSSESSDQDGVTTTEKWTTFHLLGNPTSAVTTTYSWPRLAVDYFLIDGFTLGGSVAYITASQSLTQEEGNETREQDAGTVSGFLLSPRAGYVFMFHDVLGIWPRLGITYLSLTAEDEDGEVVDEFDRQALLIEALFVAAPFENLAFTLGPTLDIGLSGSREVPDFDTGQGTVKEDIKATDIGVHAGLVGYF